jgi:hypothetical protein
MRIHVIVFLAEIYVIKAYVMKNIEKYQADRNIYILYNSQTAIKALDNFHLNFKTIVECHQTLVILAEHNRIQLVWVLSHTGIDGH